LLKESQSTCGAAACKALKLPTAPLNLASNLVICNFSAAFEETRKINRNLFSQCRWHRGLAVSPCQAGEGAVFRGEVAQGTDEIVQGREQDLIARVSERNGLRKVAHVLRC